MTKIIDKMDIAAKVKEFNEGATALQTRTRNDLLGEALGAKLRKTQYVVITLEQFTTAVIEVPSVAMLIDIIRNGGDTTQVDPWVMNLVTDSNEADRLMSLYAEIMGAPVVESERGRHFDWSEVDFVDTITVPIN